MNRRATIHDVARHAGVSTVTVSRVINEPVLVKPATRARVEGAMRVLGYVPNAAARSMRTNLTRQIGCLLPDLINHPNAAIAQHAEHALAAAGYSLLLANSGYDPAAEARAIDAFRTRGVDGLMLYVSDEADPALLAAVRGADVPLLLLDREIDAPADILASEHTPAMRETVRLLVGLGHRRIALVLSDLPIRPVRARSRAFADAAAALGLKGGETARILNVPPEDGQRAVAARELLARADRPTAIIAEGARQLAAIIAAARAAGLAIPADLSLVGMDAADIAAVATPELTVIDRDYAAIGTTAARLLLERIADPGAPLRRLELPSSVVLGGSCGPAPAVSAIAPLGC